MSAAANHDDLIVDTGQTGGLLVEGTVATRAVRSESEVRSSAQLRWVLMAAGAVLVLIFGLSQWPGGETTDPDAETATADDETDDEEEAPEDSAAEDEAAEDEATATTDSQPDDPSTEGDAAAVEGQQEAGPSGPVTGEAVGLGVIVANTMTERLSLLDLDTGLVHELSAAGIPLGVIGGTLFVQYRDAVRLFPLDSPEAEGETLDAGPGSWNQVISITEDRAWVIEGDPSPGSTGWVVGAYDASGRRVDESVYNPIGSLLSWDPLGEFRQGGGGGVYRRSGSRFDRVSTGVLITAGEKLALVRECDDQMVCGDNWYRRDDWQPVDLPAPPIPGQGRVLLQGDDRWLYVSSWVESGATLYEVATGSVAREVKSQDFTSLGEVPAAAISPDGRWWFEMGGPAALVVDLDSGREWPVENDDLPIGSSGLFVDLADVGFLP